MRTAVTVVVVSLLLVPAAWAQTTTTTGIPTTTTVDAPPPTLPPPDQLPRPPDAFLGSASGEVRGEIQMSCWREPPLFVCSDRFQPIDPAVSLTVQTGELLTLRFDRPISPTRVTVFRSDRPAFPFPTVNALEVPAANPTQFRADLAPGTYFLSVSTLWEQGDATYVFEITVVASTTTTCNGRTPTIVGTDARDSIFGTPGVDVILGRDGNDVILGLGGDDVICGGEGADALLGGDGNDRLVGEAGDDGLVGGNGDDAILGGPGRDRLAGDAGADSLDGGGDRDMCVGGLGIDTGSACEATVGVP